MDKVNNSNLNEPRYKEAFFSVSKKRPRSLHSLGLASLLREINEARQPHTCSRPCAFDEKKTKKNGQKRNPAAPKTHNEIHSSSATAATSGRHGMKHAPSVNSHSPASIDPGFVEIGLVQLSQSVKTTNVTHTDRQTDRQTN